MASEIVFEIWRLHHRPRRRCRYDTAIRCIYIRLFDFQRKCMVMRALIVHTIGFDLISPICEFVFARICFCIVFGIGAANRRNNGERGAEAEWAIDLMPFVFTHPFAGNSFYCRTKWQSSISFSNG